MSQLHTPNPTLSPYPIENVEGNLFPPVCLQTHWDPTLMLKHILPQQKVGLPQDFRPWVKVCKQYVTSGPAMEAPLPPSNMVFPMGGEFYPPGRYAQAIDAESVLRTLDKPLDKWCPTTQYIPLPDSTLYVAGSTVPERKGGHNAFIDELAMPQALLRTDIYTCRSANDTKNFERSGRLFNNPTKQDRYGAEKFYAHQDATVSLETGQRYGRGDPMPHGGVNRVRPLPQAADSKKNVNPAAQAQVPRSGFPQPGGALPLDKLNEARALRSGSFHKGFNHTDDISVVGVATCGSAAPVW